jgi:PKD repeat protein
VTDNDGATDTFSKTVSVVDNSNKAPTAGFRFSISGLAASFTDTSTDSDGTITSRSWSFGDGSVSTSANPSHTYAIGGSYTVRQAVTDNDGATTTLIKKIVVISPTQQSGILYIFCYLHGCDAVDQPVTMKQVNTGTQSVGSTANSPFSSNSEIIGSSSHDSTIQTITVLNDFFDSFDTQSEDDITDTELDDSVDEFDTQSEDDVTDTELDDSVDEFDTQSEDDVTDTELDDSVNEFDILIEADVTDTDLDDSVDEFENQSTTVVNAIQNATVVTALQPPTAPSNLTAPVLAGGKDKNQPKTATLKETDNSSNEQSTH